MTIDKETDDAAQPEPGERAPSPIVFRLDPGSGVPTYLQLVQQVEHAIRLGYLGLGDRLPTVKEVVGSLAINPNTVLKAYRELEHRGLAAGRPGQGTFVQGWPCCLAWPPSGWPAAGRPEVARLFSPGIGLAGIVRRGVRRALRGCHGVFSRACEPAHICPRCPATGLLHAWATTLPLGGDECTS